jgi:hypothetical protein
VVTGDIKESDMITLTNGDKWIISEKELESVDGFRTELPPTDIKDFLEELLNGNCLPRKLVNNSLWDCNFDAHTEILTAIAVVKKVCDFFVVYEMAWGEIIVIYHDQEGYDPVLRAGRFEDRRAYMEYLKLPER